MRTTYFIVLHIINLFFLVVLGFLAVAMFANISAGAPFPFNPVNIGVLTFLLLLLVANYIFQLKKDKWLVLLIGTIIYIAVFLFVILVVYPFLYGSFLN